jgi:hypothetical protein
MGCCGVEVGGKAWWYYYVRGLEGMRIRPGRVKQGRGDDHQMVVPTVKDWGFLRHPVTAKP